MRGLVRGQCEVPVCSYSDSGHDPTPLRRVPSGVAAGVAGEGGRIGGSMTGRPPVCLEAKRVNDVRERVPADVAEGEDRQAVGGVAGERRVPAVGCPAWSMPEVSDLVGPVREACSWRPYFGEQAS